MLEVKVTVMIGARIVPLDEVNDARIATGLRGAARDVGTKLERVRCPKHKRGPRDVRIHFDRNGVADLKYDSCCEELGKAVGRALG
jgi:hypothetical protein